jgi:hypothetical protein
MRFIDARRGRLGVPRCVNSDRRTRVAMNFVKLVDYNTYNSHGFDREIKYTVNTMIKK